LTPHVLVAGAVMIAASLAARWLLAAPLGDGWAALLGALAAAIGGAAVLSRAGPSGSWGAIADLTRAVQAMRDGAFKARVAVSEQTQLAPLAKAINDLAASAAASMDATEKEKELLSGILDGMVEGVIVFDRGGHIVQANLAARRLAVSEDDVVGRSAIEAFRSAALAGVVERALRRAEAGPRELEFGGVPARRLLVRTVERTDKEGGGVIVVLHDVTDLRRLETIRTEFVANVSHELRTPVTAITSAAETLLAGALDDRKDADEFVEIIERNARRLRRLVEDLLDLSKIEGKAFKIALAEEELRPIFAQARKLAEDAAARRRMSIVLEDPGELSAWVDRHAFEQVLGNLLDNAIKYAGDGAGITVSARLEGDMIAVSVADTGSGIAPQHLERLFERFYRVDTGRSREMGGTGLGLAIVKHLVESMGGAVAVKSELGRGTTFTLRVPRMPVSPREDREGDSV
jgi:two-component system, OmpR family, phosphate regulon sensor histidine kinase PhoR